MSSLCLPLVDIMFFSIGNFQTGVLNRQNTLRTMNIPTLFRLMSQYFREEFLVGKSISLPFHPKRVRDVCHELFDSIVLVKRFCRKGIPDHIRPTVWMHLSGAYERMEANPDAYQIAVSKVPPTHIWNVILAGMFLPISQD